MFMASEADPRLAGGFRRDGMERILVGLDSTLHGKEALWRAMELTKRIAARLYVLVVLTPDAPLEGTSENALSSAVKSRLEMLRQWAQEEGVPVDCFVTQGKFEEEVVHFVKQHKITLLVAESSTGETRQNERDQALESIRHRVQCRLEMVTPKKIQEA